MKTKKQIYFSVVAILVFAIISLLSTSVYAVTPTFWGACSRGVHVYYYIDGGSNNVLYQSIRDAAYNWEHTGHGANPIYLYIKSASSGTAIDFYNTTSGFWGADGQYVLGETFHRNSSGARIDPDTSHWLYSEIYLNTDLLNGNYSWERQGTAAHEMGHAFGLAHYTNTTNPNISIMCTTGQGRTVQTVQPEDNEAINIKY